MARCGYCNQEIRTGERFILEGKYPNFIHKMSFGPIVGLDYFGTIHHATCFYERVQPRPRARTEIIVRAGEAKKRCPQCGTEFSVDFNFCPNCGGFEHPP